MAAPNDTDSLNTPFTDEQMEYLWERDIRLSTHGTEWSRKHIRAYARRATAGFLVLALGVAGAFYAGGRDSAHSREAIVKSGRVVSIFGCNRDFVTVNRLRDVLSRSADFQRAALARGDITQAQFDRAAAYFREQLAGLPPVDCRPSATLITDDPTDIGQVPKPLYPPPKPSPERPH